MMRVGALLLAVGVLVFFLLFFINTGNSQASLGRQMADVVNDFPHLVIVENALPRGHSGGIDAVINYPFELPVSVVLNVFGREVRNRRSHLVCEGHARCLAIQPVANSTVMTEMFAALGNIFFGSRQRIRHVFPAHRHLVFHFFSNFVFDIAGFAHATAAANE